MKFERFKNVQRNVADVRGSEVRGADATDVRSQSRTDCARSIALYVVFIVMDDENLIEWVRAYECLYNNQRKDYKDFSAKQTAWERIGSELNIPRE